jgi:hypothetical protein
MITALKAKNFKANENEKPEFTKVNEDFEFEFNAEIQRF